MELRLPLEVVQEMTSSTDFLLWQEYLKRRLNAFHRQDHFQAQIAIEIRRIFNLLTKQRTDENQLRKEMLLQFHVEAATPVSSEPEEMTQEEFDRRCEEEKSKWFGFLGMGSYQEFAKKGEAT
jgi:hypothetical protein